MVELQVQQLTADVAIRMLTDESVLRRMRLRQKNADNDNEAWDGLGRDARIAEEQNLGNRGAGFLCGEPGGGL
jgi:hypothetical protein